MQLIVINVAWSVTIVSPTKTAEPKCPLGCGLWWAPRNHILDGVQIPRWKGVILREKRRPIVKYREYRPCVVTMQPSVTLLWLLTICSFFFLSNTTLVNKNYNCFTVLFSLMQIIWLIYSHPFCVDHYILSFKFTAAASLTLTNLSGCQEFRWWRR